MSRPSPIAVVLAAGGSTRMGEPKALLRHGGSTLLAHHVRGLHAAGLAVRVAVGGDGDRVAHEALAEGAAVVRNPDWRTTGPTRSLIACLVGVHPDTPVLVTPVDVPPAPAPVLRALLDHSGDAVVQFALQDGHPVRVEAGRAQRLQAGETLRDALRAATRLPLAWPDALRNLNTPAAFRSWSAAARS